MDASSRRRGFNQSDDSDDGGGKMGRVKRPSNTSSSSSSGGSGSSDESRGIKKLKRSKRQSASKRFPGKLHDMLNYCETQGRESIVSWIENGTAFEVRKPEKLHEILPIFFSHSHYTSLQRQLQIYSFQRLRDGTWSHPYFLRGKRSMCDRLDRRDFQAARRKVASNSAAKPRQDVSLNNPTISPSPAPVGSDNNLQSISPPPPLVASRNMQLAGINWNDPLDEGNEERGETKHEFKRDDEEAKVEELWPSGGSRSSTSGSSLSSMLSHIFEVNREVELSRRNSFPMEEFAIPDPLWIGDDAARSSSAPTTMGTNQQPTFRSMEETENVQMRTQSPGFLPLLQQQLQRQQNRNNESSSMTMFAGQYLGATNSNIGLSNANENSIRQDGTIRNGANSTAASASASGQSAMNAEATSSPAISADGRQMTTAEAENITSSASLQLYTPSFIGMFDPMDADSDEYERLFD